MRVAALYDIHGNFPALEAVLDEIRGAHIERVVVGGDVVPGPLPRETLTRLLELEVPTQFICGNGEIAVLDELAGRKSRVPEHVRPIIQWCAEQLTAQQRELLGQWPKTLAAEMNSLGRVLFCHATPRDENEIFTRETAEESVLPAFTGTDADLVVCGHTHMQFDRNIGNVRVVNAGSVGMPFGEPGAHWVLLDNEIEFRHTSYDLPAAAARIRASNYREAEEFVENDLLHPRSTDEMLALYRKAELR